VAIVRNAHVGVDYLTRHLSPAVVRPLNIVLAAMIAVALAFVAGHAILLTQDNVRAEWGTVPFMSMAVPYAAVPVGVCLMLLAFLRVMARLYSGRLPGVAPPGAGADL
jgi:TRAP-type C4-dicarboxylate transport system permease small subunit